jgi:hypothetical protein
MKEKIKNFFEFVKSAWVAGPRGRWGFLFMILAIFFFIRLFCGTQNIQGFIMNAWNLNRERAELEIAQKQLQQIQHHIYLLQHPNSSSDYIQELGLQTLNLGDRDFKELKY